jgi:hypothetical protein
MASAVVPPLLKELEGLKEEKNSIPTVDSISPYLSQQKKREKRDSKAV